MAKKKKQQKKAAAKATSVAQAAKNSPNQSFTPTQTSSNSPTAGALTQMQSLPARSAPAASLGNKGANKLKNVAKKGNSKAQEEAFLRVMKNNPQLAEKVKMNPDLVKRFAIPPQVIAAGVGAVGSAIGAGSQAGPREPEEFDQYGKGGKKAINEATEQNDSTRVEGATAQGATATQGGNVRNEGLGKAKEDYLKSKGIEPGQYGYNANGEPIIPKKLRDGFKNEIKKGTFNDYGISLGKGGKIKGKEVYQAPEFTDEARTGLDEAGDDYNEQVLGDMGGIFNDFATDARASMGNRQGIMDYLNGSFGNTGAEGLTERDYGDIDADMASRMDAVKMGNRDLMQSNVGRLMTSGVFDGSNMGSVLRDQVQEGTGKLLRGAVADNSAFRQQLLNDKTNRVNQTRQTATGVLTAMNPTTSLNQFTSSVMAPGAYGGTTTKDRYDMASGSSNDAQGNVRDDAKVKLESSKKVIA